MLGHSLIIIRTSSSYILRVERNFLIIPIISCCFTSSWAERRIHKATWALATFRAMRYIYIVCHQQPINYAPSLVCGAARSIAHHQGCWRANIFN